MSEDKKTTKDVLMTTNTVIVEMGTVEASLINKLKQGHGDLMDEVNEIIDEISEQLKDKDESRIFMPVVIIYERKNP